MDCTISARSRGYREITMKPARSSNEWLAPLRTMSLLQRLMQGPASADELISFVCSKIGESAYPKTKSARDAAFKHDRDRLKKKLGVEFQYDPVKNIYILTNPGPFGILDLSEDSLRGLALLARDFGNGFGERAYIRSLLDELLIRLSPETKRLMDTQPESLILGVKQFVDKGEIPPKVWEAVKRSVEKRRKVSFNYLSPRYENRQSVYFEVAPFHLKYQEGHWYLRGWVLKRKPQEFDFPESEYIRFRVTYIQNDEKLKVLPTVIPQQYRTPPRYLVRYKLSPEIGRGEISHHFLDMEITRNADGSAEVKGYTEDVWEAGRLLLSYGEGCVVLGGEELSREVRRRVEGMAKNYFFLD